MGLLLGSLILAATPAQQFTNVSAKSLPPLGSSTEAAKFGDWDLDGDLDLVYANGGDAGNQQSRVLFNRGLTGNGGAGPGTIGTFADATATNLSPNLIQSSRDVTIVDIDGDGDLDFHFSNHSDVSFQSNTWFVNQGLAQGGTLGVFALDMSHWEGLGLPGSSVAPALLITSGSFAGGFIDWCSQSDVADVDLDGDMDLMHTSIGSVMNALVMTRLFLNGNGTEPGFFREFNPSDAVSPNPNLNAGNPAGFAEGKQLDNTSDSSGALHDLTTMSLDVDFSDLDGDFDNDVFLNSRDTTSRFFRNRFFESGAKLDLFRDVTSDWGANGLAVAQTYNYDADLNDMDNDNDSDFYGVNYSGGIEDEWRTNDGAGHMSPGFLVPNSFNDDHEIDWCDFDQDGDVDVFISAFSSSDRFYRNQFLETGSIELTELSGMADAPGTHSTGADVGDADNDGDFDIVAAQDGTHDEVLLRNNLDVPDAVAPRVADLLQLVSGPPSSTPRRVVARVYDNANPEYLQHGSAEIHFTVNGIARLAPARYAGGNLVVGTIPGYWTGAISYSVVVRDRQGNAGTSPVKSVTIPSAGVGFLGTDAPGCAGAHVVAASSAPTIANPEFGVAVTACPPLSLGLGLATNAPGTGNDLFGIGVPIWAGLAGATEIYGFDLLADDEGIGFAPIPIPADPFLVGKVYYLQFILAESACSLPPLNLSATAAIVLTILP